MTKPVTIGLISDTHGWLNPKISQAFNICDFIIHAGDIGNPEVIEKLEEFASVTVVKGNIDGGSLRFLPLEATLQTQGFKIGVLHIAGNPHRPNNRARQFIQRENLDIIVVGHTHIPVVTRFNSTLWINPGAAGREGHHDLCFAARMILQEGKEIQLERVHLGARADMPLRSD